MEVKKSILVLGINCFPELTGIGKYSGEMIRWFADNGHPTTMVTAPPYYPNWKVSEPYRAGNFMKERIGANLIIYRCPLYVPAEPSGMKRLIHEFSFFLSAFMVVFKLLFEKKHDLILAVAPPFHLGFLALFYRLFKGGKIVYHIQDLQIEAAKELKMLRPWMFGLLFSLERFILNRVDVVSTISEGMRRKIALKANKQVVIFPNWVDTVAFYPIADRNSVKQHWGFAAEDRLVVYSGSIGEKQGLDSLIRIAASLREQESIKFIICGTGPFKPKLEQMALEQGLRNITFLPLQPEAVFNEFLNLADLHLVLQKGDASDLVMPSKLTTILSVGGMALVTAHKGTSLHEVVAGNGLGLVIAPDDEPALRNGIVQACLMDQVAFRSNARQYAETNLNKNNILKRFIYEELAE